MELRKTLDVTAEEFFDQIERSVLSDIKSVTDAELGREQLDGFEYEKRASGGRGAGTPMKVRIVTYRYPAIYRVEFAYARGTAAITYELTKLDSGSSRLAYSEEFTASEPLRGFNRQIGLALYERQARSRARRTIRSIVSFIHKQRRCAGSNPLLAELGDDGKKPKVM
ncbi:hypothetical protein Corgl_0629 [Coriobacterium glomerans PW2]|uniref:DUF3284 domain-containing protein n=1 Tax=Coriobacterium glomerans (strain ATCC 49209 / DSM 20642 / JCM 10262 / PW2) TaxID=700015 RepID=F2NBK7_CORGP|nr:DUF3284 domain-containing protein [Coriobacterium glomerans]AEB06743.1 hypothetical protein Corgl_0629 [Coriobacterium glomerans PW2]